MDWGTMFDITWNAAFFANMLSIIVINLVLSGDNAVLIAMAVRNLPKEQRLKGITFGTAVAVVLRIILTFFCCLPAGDQFHQACRRASDSVDCCEAVHGIGA